MALTGPLAVQRGGAIAPLAQVENIIGIIGWSIVLIVFLVGMFAAVSYLKKWMRDDDGDATGPVSLGLTLSDLRKIHERGEMTDEEYERARNKMMAAAKAQTAKMPDPAGGRRAPGASPAVAPPPDSAPSSSSSRPSPPPRPPPTTGT